MVGLSGIINGLRIDDRSSLAELEKTIANKDIRHGVFRQSTNFRNMNLMSNYENGGRFRVDAVNTYGYFCYDKSTASLVRPSMRADNIGTSAEIDFYGNNSNLNFVTTDSFLGYNHIIRANNIDRKKARTTWENDYSIQNPTNGSLKKYMDEFDKSFSIGVVFDNSAYGDLYEKNDYDSMETINNGDLLGTIGNIVRTSMVSSDKMSKQKRYVSYDEVKKVFSTEPIVGVEYFNNRNIKYPESVYSSEGVLGKNTDRMEEQFKFSMNLGLNTKSNQYAFDDIPDFIFDPGSVRGRSDYKDRDVVKDNGGFLTKYNDVSGARSYFHYEESDNNHAVTKIDESETYKDSTVIIDNFSGDTVSRLLSKTNELFKQNKIKSLVNRFSTGKIDVNDELETSYSQYGLSRGRNLLSNDSESKTGFFNPYCRVWTAARQYSKLKHRIRPFYDSDGNDIGIKDLQSSFGELRPNNGAERLEKFGVLKNNGFVKICPEHKDGVLSDDKIKKYMFSIENLAWKDVITTAGLSEEQKGPNNGRIMWFPPYNLKFTENVNVEWNSNKFIGRGEQIYTYTNTDRSGTLSFTLLIDHPSILNKWRTTADGIDKDPYENDILRFFAGCCPLEGNVAGSQQSPEGTGDDKVLANNLKRGKKSKTYAYVVFFPNNYSGRNDGVEQAIDVLSRYETTYSDIISDVDSDFSGHTAYNENTSENSLNSNPSRENIDKIRATLLSDEGDLAYGEDDDAPLVIIPLFNPESGLSSLPELVTNDEIFGNNIGDCQIEKIRVKGFASSHGDRTINNKLAMRRAQMIIAMVKHSCFYLSNSKYQVDDTEVIDVIEDNTNESRNEIDAKIARSAVLMIDVTWKDAVRVPSSVEYGGNGVEISAALNQEYEKDRNIDRDPEEKKIASNTRMLENQVYKYDNEYLYFSEVVGDDLVYKNIIDKVRYFSPAFHSITPEGFNSRLTFLQQCTRQGPTLSRSGGRVNTESSDYLKFGGNLSFGRPPYCILRIGDFFHTKICITSLSIDYDNGGGLQWDLNPEGIGVQPMYANININFNFIGGQDIAGPVERLQNAVSYNYYANASIYDIKADAGRVTNGLEEGPSKVPYDPFNGEDVDYYSNS